jgi:hypothetical protein
MGAKSTLEASIPDELELKILAAFKTMRVPAIVKELHVERGKVYNTLRKFKKPLKSHSSTEGTKYGRKTVKKRLPHTERLTTPFKTNQLT